MTEEIANTEGYLFIDALKIILTGPVQISNPLDFSQTTAKEYREIQETVKDKMQEDLPYKFEIPKSGSGQKYEMNAGGTGKAHSSSYYLECITDCKKIKYKFEKYDFTIKKMKVKFYEFGFATVSIFGVISSKDSSKENVKISSSDLLRVVDDLDEKIVSGEAQQIKALISKVTKKFDEAIKENKIKKFFANEKSSNEATNASSDNSKALREISEHEVDESSQSDTTENISNEATSEISEHEVDKSSQSDTTENISNEATNTSSNNIKSLHRIFKYEVDENSEFDISQKTFDQIARLSNGEWQKEDSFSHFVGVANSVIVYDGNLKSNAENIENEIFKRYQEAYNTVLETANAYYFIAEFMKNRLSDYSRESVEITETKNKFDMFKIFSIFKVFNDRKKLSQAETGLNIFVFLTSNFFSVTDEFIVNLNSQKQNIWDKMDEVWNTSKTIKMQQDQLQNSLLITDRILKQTANRQQKWLNWVATVFTVIGAISLVEIAQSEGLNWKFDKDTIIPNSLDEFVSNPINLIGSILAVVFILAVILGLPCYYYIQKRNRKNSQNAVGTGEKNEICSKNSVKK